MTGHSFHSSGSGVGVGVEVGVCVAVGSSGVDVRVIGRKGVLVAVTRITGAFVEVMVTITLDSGNSADEDCSLKVSTMAKTGDPDVEGRSVWLDATTKIIISNIIALKKMTKGFITSSLS
jgi:hypothetical protein